MVDDGLVGALRGAVLAVAPCTRVDDDNDAAPDCLVALISYNSGITTDDDDDDGAAIRLAVWEK